MKKSKENDVVRYGTIHRNRKNIIKNETYNWKR